MGLPASPVGVDGVLTVHEAFRQETPYCNWHHPTIQRVMRSTTAHARSEREAAQALFLWVRDHILFQVGRWNTTASETLTARTGTCTNKANLLVALARAAGIPAAYFVQKVAGKEYLGPIVPATLRQQIAPRSTHVHPALFVNHRWVRCDPTDDRLFAEHTVHLNPQSALVSWDGEHDAGIQLDPTHILEETGPLSEIDAVIARVPRIPTAIVRLGNCYVRFLRDSAHHYQTQDAVEQGFQLWLRWRHPVWYLLYLGLSRRRVRADAGGP